MTGRILPLLMLLLGLLAAMQQGVAQTPGTATGASPAAQAPSDPRTPPPVLVLGSREGHALAGNFQVLEDPDLTLEVDDMVRPEVRARFETPPPERWQNLGYTDGAFWLSAQLAVPAGAPREWLLEVAFAPLDRVELYVARPEGGFDRKVAGRLVPGVERAYTHRHHVFKLSLPTGAPTQIYLRAQNSASVTVPVALWQAEALWQRDVQDYVYLAAYFGLLIALLLYNLLLYLSLRDRLYLMYVISVAAMILWQGANTGLGVQVLWPQWDWWNARASYVAAAISGGSGMLVAREFLQTARTRPWADRALLALVAGWAAMALYGLAGQTPHPAFGNLIGMGTVAAMVWTAVMCLVDRQPGGRYFFLAWFALGVGVVVSILRSVGVVPSNVLTNHALLLGSAIDLILLSFALSHRVAAIRTDNERIRAREQAERQQRQQAERASREKSRFMRTIAHDFRQPLYALELFLERLTRADTDAASRGQLAAKLEDALQSASALLDSLVTASRFEEGLIRPTVTRFPIAPVLARIEQNFGMQAAQSELDLRVRPCNAVVRSDPALLERMLSNLVTNALRYTRSGGVLVGCRRRGSTLLVQVWDTGIGIAPEHQQAVFEQFFRVRHTDAGHERGFGLGLAMVASAAGQLGHTLRLTSVPGRGSCFSIELPMADAADADAADAIATGPDANARSDDSGANAPHTGFSPSSAAALETATTTPTQRNPAPEDIGPLAGLRVLVIDDDPNALTSTCALLTDWHCLPLPARSTQEAQDVIAEAGAVPALLLCDLHLDQGELGTDAIAQIRTQLGHTLPAILMSADTSLEAARLAAAHGLPLIAKPLAPARLAALMRRVTGGA